VNVAFYRIAQEALNNVAKHSGATSHRHAIALADRTADANGAAGARLVVEDDGTGFDPAAAGGGQLGLGIMRERADAVDAVLHIHSAPGQGTTVTVSWSPAALEGMND
jgi:signal transduction histidine kinase